MWQSFRHSLSYKSLSPSTAISKKKRLVYWRSIGCHFGWWTVLTIQNFSSFWGEMKKSIHSLPFTIDSGFSIHFCQCNPTNVKVIQSSLFDERKIVFVVMVPHFVCSTLDGCVAIQQVSQTIREMTFWTVTLKQWLLWCSKSDEKR